MRKKEFSDFSFQNFFGFWEKNFSDFQPKNFKKSSKLPSTCPEEQFVAWNFFLKFWIFSDFLQNPLAWFSKFYLRVQIKNCGKNSFFCFLFRIFFGFWAKLFQTFGQIFKKLWKLPSACPQEQLVASNFFKTFWTVLDFVQKPLAWFSKFFLGVKSKNCGRNSFLIFFSDFFRILTENFSDFWPNLQKVVKTTFCVSTGTTCGFNFFFKSFEPFWIFCRNLWHGSQISFYVSRVKIAEETVFLFFFSDFFRILSETFSDFWPNLQKVVKTTFCVSTGTTCGF